MNKGNINIIFKQQIFFTAITFLVALLAFSPKRIYITHDDVKNFFANCFVSDTLLIRSAYVAAYTSRHGQSSWVLYRLKREYLHGQVTRKNTFKADPDLPNAIMPSVYTKSGFDRGHLAPAADFSWSEQAMAESFYMSNISPQYPGFNRGVWKRLEDKVRQWAEEKQDLIIVVGPILTDSLEQLKEQVSIPSIFYKIILDKRKNEAIAFLMKNASSSLPLETFAVSVDSVEALSGIDFFYKQDSLWQQKVECCYEKKLWFN